MDFLNINNAGETLGSIHLVIVRPRILGCIDLKWFSPPNGDLTIGVTGPIDGDIRYHRLVYQDRIHAYLLRNRTLPSSGKGKSGHEPVTILRAGSQSPPFIGIDITCGRYAP